MDNLKRKIKTSKKLLKAFVWKCTARARFARSAALLQRQEFKIIDRLDHISLYFKVELPLTEGIEREAAQKQKFFLVN